MATVNMAKRRYTLRLIPLMIVYVIVIFAVSYWFRSKPEPGPLSYGMSILPALPVVGVIWAMGRYLVEEKDEYLRQKQARAMLWGTGITLTVCTVWGFMQTYDMAPPIPLFWVFVLFCLSFGVARGLDCFFPART